MTDVNMVAMYNEAGEHVGFKARSTKDVLTAARAVIDTPEKWYQGDWCNDDYTCFCSMGAIAVALGQEMDAIQAGNGSACDNVVLSPATRFLERYLRDKDIPEWYSIAGFNDATDTDHALVMTIFDSAIAEAEKQNA